MEEETWKVSVGQRGHEVFSSIFRKEVSEHSNLITQTARKVKKYAKTYIRFTPAERIAKKYIMYDAAEIVKTEECVIKSEPLLSGMYALISQRRKHCEEIYYVLD